MKNYGAISKKVNSILHGGDYNPDQWIDMPEIIEADVKLMKLAHVNSVSLGIFSWTSYEKEEGVYDFSWLDEMMDLMAENGTTVILATPSGAKPAWMAQKYPEVLRVDEYGRRQLYGQRHNHCPSSPIYREKVHKIDTLLAERYKDHPALAMWHISNEFEGDCHCPLCQAAFREWLKKRYGSLETLNKAWWTKFWSHTFTDWNQISGPSPIGEPELHGLTLDWHRFTTDQAVDFYYSEVKTVKAITPDIPVTTNFHDFTRVLQFDYWKFAEKMDVISWDNYPMWHSQGEDDVHEGSRRAFIHDLNRSMGGGRPFMMMESSPSSTNWQPVAKLRRPGMHNLQSLQAVAHGSDTVQYFQWRKSRGSSEKLHGAVVDHVGNENTRVFREVAETGAILEKLKDVVGTSVEPDCAVIFDWENAWAIRDCQGPRIEHKDYWETCQYHYKALWEQNIPCDIINEDRDFSKYKMIVAPMLYMIRSGVGERINKFIENGGIFVCTYWSGLANESDLCYLGGFPGPIKKSMGIWSEELDSLYDGEKRLVRVRGGDKLDIEGNYEAEIFCDLIHAEGASVLAEYGEDFYKGMPALTVNSFGKGNAYYIAFRNNDNFLKDFYAALQKKYHFTKATETSTPYGVIATTRYDEKNRFVFFMNFTAEEKSFTISETDFEDAVDGSRESSVTLSPYGVKIIRKKI